jgi:hypothetical protein
MSKAAKTPVSFSAWCAALPESETYWGIMPPGYMSSFWLIVIAKNVLQQKLSHANRLAFSNILDHQRNEPNITAEMIAMIQPAGKAELEMFAAASNADPAGDDRGRLSYGLLSSFRMFDLLVLANPSVLDAIKYGIAQRKVPNHQLTCAAPDGSALRPASGDGPERYHIHSVPTQTGGPASNYDAPARFWPGEERSEQQRFAEGTPNNKPINPHTGR